jgi:hypothetical protein
MKLQQLVLDTVAHLPKLETLRIVTFNSPPLEDELHNFEPIQGLRYVEELEINSRWYALERDGERSKKYREIF